MKALALLARRGVLIGVAAAALAGCTVLSPTLPPTALIVQPDGVVTTQSGAPTAGALIGPVTLEQGTVGGTTCFWVRDPKGVRHGVVWPFGTVATAAGIDVPGLSVALTPGQPFWSGGGEGEGNVPELGACDAPPDLYLGGDFSLTDPVPSGG